MRQPRFVLFGLLLSATALTGQAQENKTPEQKPAAAPETTTDTEKPKNEVEKMIAKLQAKGDLIVFGCAEPCEETGENAGVLNGQAISLPKPAYPPIARAAHAEGSVEVQVLIDYDGKVIAAAVVSGHPLLRATSIQAARNSLFSATKLDGKPVMVAGVIRYNFVAQ